MFFQTIMANKNMSRFFSIIFILSLLACQGKKTTNSTTENQVKTTATKEITDLSFKEEMHNFGSLQAGEIVVYSFVFTNTGKQNLIIEDVISDCGCVHARYSEKPVLPGKTGLIEVEFDSAGLFGRQYKTIEIRANTKKPKQLAIFAEVDNEQLEIKY